MDLNQRDWDYVISPRQEAAPIGKYVEIARESETMSPDACAVPAHEMKRILQKCALCFWSRRIRSDEAYAKNAHCLLEASELRPRQLQCTRIEATTLPPLARGDCTRGPSRGPLESTFS